MTTRILSKEAALATCMLVAIIGLAFPYHFPLFILVVIGWFGLLLLNGQLSFRLTVGMLPLLFSIGFFLLGIVLSFGKMYDIVTEDLINIITVLLIWPMATGINREGLRRFLNLYLRWIFPLMVAIALVGLYKFYLLLNGQFLSFISPETSLLKYPLGTALMTDYNMFAFGQFSGLLAGIYGFGRSRTLFSRIWFVLGSIIIVTAIVFAGSRRGWVVAGLAVFYAVVMMFRTLRRIVAKKRIARRLLVNVLVILGVLGGVAALVIPRIPIERFLTTAYALEMVAYRFGTLTGQSYERGGSFSSRTDLWVHAVGLVSDYSFIEWSIGSGFDYIAQYGSLASSGEGYPHNPIISALLYSGILGALTVIVLIAVVFVRAWQSRKWVGTNQLLLLYLVSLLFLLPSGNSIFSIKTFPLQLLILLAVNTTSISQPSTVASSNRNDSLTSSSSQIS